MKEKGIYIPTEGSELLSYYFTEDLILVNNVWFYGDKSYFTKLTSMVS